MPHSELFGHLMPKLIATEQCHQHHRKLHTHAPHYHIYITNWKAHNLKPQQGNPLL